MLGRTLVAAAFAGAAIAAPTGLEARQSTNIDTTILQFALTLEHLENVFYKQAIANFSLADFQAAGYDADYYNNLHYIAYDEQVHVQALSAALTAANVAPNAACTYNFPYTDVPSFITLSSVLEGVGTSAYLGAAPLITSKYYLTVAGSILAVEALHTSYQRAAIGEVPMANPFETPLDPMSVYTLAAAFIVSCPPSNAPLPFTAFPSLAVNTTYGTCEEPNCGVPANYIKREAEAEAGSWKKHGGEPGSYPPGKPSTSSTSSPPADGTTVTFTAGKPIPAGSYVTFVNGLTVTSVKGTISGDNISAAIPTGIAGQTYVFVSSSDQETTFSDTAVLFGPAILEVYPPAPALNYSILKA